MIIKEALLKTVCGITSTLPENDHPDIALAGKSNVGKSSLLNGLMNRKSLARISAVPGKTQTINFYFINNSFYLVDLPGYGYAKVSLSEKRKWAGMVEGYLKKSKQLAGILLLIDIRHGPGEHDKAMLSFIKGAGLEPVIVATKLDKLKRSQVAKHLAKLREELEGGEDLVIFPFSAKTKAGREAIYRYIEEKIEKLPQYPT